MHWIDLNNEAQLNQIKQQSFTRPQLIFKHSIKCSISSTAKARLERKDLPVTADYYYLDLINHRSISNQVAEVFNVWHESPQILLIKNGECVYDESHMGITANEVTEQVNLVA
jgi:bacillithiol system protein YtxJ